MNSNINTINKSKTSVLYSLKFRNIINKNNNLSDQLDQKKNNTFFSNFNFILPICFFFITTSRSFSRDLTEAAKNELSVYEYVTFKSSSKNSKFKVQSFERFAVELPLYIILILILSLIERIYFYQSKNSSRFNLLIMQGILCIFIPAFYFKFLHNIEKPTIITEKQFDKKASNFEKFYRGYLNIFNTLGFGFEDETYLMAQNFPNVLLGCVCDSFYPAVITLFWTYFNEIKNKFQLNETVSKKKISSTLTMAATSSLISVFFLIFVISGTTSAKSVSLFNIRSLMFMNFIVFLIVLFLFPNVQNSIYEDLYEDLVKRKLVDKNLNNELSLEQKIYVVENFYEIQSPLSQQSKIKNKLIKRSDFSVLIKNPMLLNILFINLTYFLFSTFIKFAPSYLSDKWVKSYNRSTLELCRINKSETLVDMLLENVKRDDKVVNTFKHNIVYIMNSMTNLATAIAIKILNFLINKTKNLNKVTIISIVLIFSILILEAGVANAALYKFINIRFSLVVFVYFVDGCNRGVKYQAMDLIMILGYESKTIPSANVKTLRKSLDNHTNRASKSVFNFFATKLAEFVNYTPSVGGDYTKKDVDEIQKQSGCGNALIGFVVCIWMSINLFRLNQSLNMENQQNQNKKPNK